MKTRRPRNRSLAAVLKRIKSGPEIKISVEMVPLAVLPKHIIQMGVKGMKRRSRRPKDVPKARSTT
jgi:hypothetical protein